MSVTHCQMIQQKRCIYLATMLAFFMLAWGILCQICGLLPDLIIADSW